MPESCGSPDEHPGHEWYTPWLRRECRGKPEGAVWWQVLCTSCPDDTPVEPRLPELRLPLTTRFKGVADQCAWLHARHTGHITPTRSL